MADQPTPNAAVQSTLDLTGLIDSYIQQIERTRQNLSKQKDILDSIFDNDPTYQEHLKAAREAAKVKGATKKQLMRLAQAVELSASVQNLRSQIKELNQTLSDYLQEYARQSGQTSIETSDGVLRQIVYTARLVKATSLP